MRLRVAAYASLLLLLGGSAQAQLTLKLDAPTFDSSANLWIIGGTLTNLSNATVWLDGLSLNTTPGAPDIDAQSSFDLSLPPFDTTLGEFKSGDSYSNPELLFIDPLKYVGIVEGSVFISSSNDPVNPTDTIVSNTETFRFEVVATDVPEPGSVALFGSVLMGYGMLVARRRRTK